MSASPPIDAGASVPANDAATCATYVGAKRRRSGTEPRMAKVAPMYVTTEASTTGTNHSQFASFTWSTMPGRSLNCGSRK